MSDHPLIGQTIYVDRDIVTVESVSDDGQTFTVATALSSVTGKTKTMTAQELFGAPYLHHVTEYRRAHDMHDCRKTAYDRVLDYGRGSAVDLQWGTFWSTTGKSLSGYDNGDFDIGIMHADGWVERGSTLGALSDLLETNIIAAAATWLPEAVDWTLHQRLPQPLYKYHLLRLVVEHEHEAVLLRLRCYG